MGTNNTVSTNNQSFTDYSTDKIFIGCNSFKGGQSFTNGGGAEIVLAKGTVVGRKTADQELGQVLDTSADGTEFAIGVVADDYTVGAGATITNVVICIAGDVNKNLLVLDGADTLDTVITATGRTIGDSLEGDSAGIVLKDSTELNEYGES